MFKYLIKLHYAVLKCYKENEILVIFKYLYFLAGVTIHDSLVEGITFQVK